METSYKQKIILIGNINREKVKLPRDFNNRYSITNYHAPSPNYHSAFPKLAFSCRHVMALDLQVCPISILLNFTLHFHYLINIVCIKFSIWVVLDLIFFHAWRQLSINKGMWKNKSWFEEATGDCNNLNTESSLVTTF